MVDCMIQVKENESVRNVAKNSLTEVTLLEDSVFFGINGSGKSTVCEVLSQAATLTNDQSNGEEPLKVFAFDEKWRKDKVGDFIEGGSAEGVTTVKLNDGAADLEERIRKAQDDWESAKSDLKTKQDVLAAAEKAKDKVIDDVFNGERKTLEKQCSSLNGSKYRRPAIRSLLEEGNSKVLSQTEVDEQLRIANSQAPGALPQLPSLPEQWSFSDALWDEVSSTTPAAQSVTLIVNDWVREGMNTHKPGDTCQFCGGLVEAERIAALTDAIRQAEEQASSLVKEELAKCRHVSSSLAKLESALENADFTSSIYGEGLQAKNDEVLIEIGHVLKGLKKAEKLLDDRVKNPHLSIQDEKPEISSTELQTKYSALSEAHTEAVNKIEGHSANQEQAVKQLKEHCCAIDGGGWKAAAKAVSTAQKDVIEADKTHSDAQDLLSTLQKEVSTTADTAQFLDQNLSLILGENSLRVEEGNVGEGYRITRHDQRADAMSEGEKKLVSLLYFCAEFMTEDRKQSMANTVVIFDDLGSELDEARLLTVDRFISNHFTNPKPAALVYFTHSHTYLKILQSRLGGRAFPSKDKGQDIPPKSIFYEVYKDHFRGGNQSTRCRKWDDDAIKLTNDYWLSFYMVLRAFEGLLDNEVPELGTGNFCRKVLEGFSEFRAPGSELFGTRIDSILAKKNRVLSPALSKVVNGLSHTELSKTGGVLSRNEVELAVIQTLKLLQVVDPDHFRALLIKFRGKQGRRNIEAELNKRTG